jgi:L,D-transpeptidase YcbB
MGRFNRWARALSGLALTVILVAGCGGKEKTLRSDRIKAWLRRMPANGVVQLASGDTINVSAATRDFYRRRFWHAAWSGNDDLLERGWLLHGAIGRAHEDGLPRERYRFDLAEKLEAQIRAEGKTELPDSLRPAYLASLDLVLTEGFNRYANDLVGGTLDPNDSGIKWRIPRDKASEQHVLRAIVNGVPPSQMVAHLRPSIPDYERMRGALVQYNQVAARGGWPHVPDEVKLEPGVRNNGVAVLRTRLLTGLDHAEVAAAQKGAADPTLFDVELQNAVKHFQERHAIDPDGKIGDGTLRELNHPVEARIDELKLNLDRWRWLPDSLGRRYVLVNIAGFELEVVDRNRVVESMNVVVGQQNWETPVFADTIEEVVVNPYWNVPPSIYRQEILPAMESDPTYLARNNFEPTSDGVRQRPGPKNALGKYKFVFPNADDIYLHDTPADHLFSRSRRDFSHGCIRLERPGDLARLIMQMQGPQQVAQLERYAESNETRHVRLKQKLPIYILYFTAWVQEDGTVRFHHDVYGRDEQLQKAAKAQRVALR